MHEQVAYRLPHHQVDRAANETFGYLPTNLELAKDGAQAFGRFLEALPPAIRAIALRDQNLKLCFTGIAPEIGSVADRPILFEVLDETQRSLVLEILAREAPHLVAVPITQITRQRPTGVEARRPHSYVFINTQAAQRVVRLHLKYFPLEAQDDVVRWMTNHQTDWFPVTHETDEEYRTLAIRHGLLSGFPLAAVRTFPDWLIGYEKVQDSLLTLEQKEFLSDLLFSQSLPRTQANLERARRLLEVIGLTPQEKAALLAAQSLEGNTPVERHHRYKGFSPGQDTVYKHQLSRLYSLSGIDAIAANYAEDGRRLTPRSAPERLRHFTQKIQGAFLSFTEREARTTQLRILERAEREPSEKTEHAAVWRVKQEIRHLLRQHPRVEWRQVSSAIMGGRTDTEFGALRAAAFPLPTEKKQLLVEIVSELARQAESVTEVYTFLDQHRDEAVEVANERFGTRFSRISQAVATENPDLALGKALYALNAQRMPVVAQLDRSKLLWIDMLVINNFDRAVLYDHDQPSIQPGHDVEQLRAPGGFFSHERTISLAGSEVSFPLLVHNGDSELRTHEEGHYFYRLFRRVHGETDEADSREIIAKLKTLERSFMAPEAQAEIMQQYQQELNRLSAVFASWAHEELIVEQEARGEFTQLGSLLAVGPRNPDALYNFFSNYFTEARLAKLPRELYQLVNAAHDQYRDQLLSATGVAKVVRQLLSLSGQDTAGYFGLVEAASLDQWREQLLKTFAEEIAQVPEIIAQKRVFEQKLQLYNQFNKLVLHLEDDVLDILFGSGSAARLRHESTVVDILSEMRWQFQDQQGRAYEFDRVLYLLPLQQWEGVARQSFPAAYRAAEQVMNERD